MTPPKVYAVRIGRTPGVYATWTECQKQTNGFQGAVYKSFSSACAAHQFVDNTIPTLAAGETDPEIQIYTDGACRNNGLPNACAGVGVWWGDNHENNLSCALEGDIQTNNRAEMVAVIEALRQADLISARIVIYTDSLYVCNGIHYVTGWRNNGWKLASGKQVSNVDLWQKLTASLHSPRTRIVHVKAHSGIYGNCEADRLAVRATSARLAEQNV